MALFLAVDAGGTKTTGVIADGTRELVRAWTGTIQLLRTDRQTASKNLESLFMELADGQGITLRSITRICVGTSGAMVPSVANWMRETIQSLAGGDLLLCGDQEIALDAAFRGGPGILIVAGTGSSVAGRTCAGEIVQVGGWGPALGDEGSGHWIGQQALRRAIRARDEGRSTLLMEKAILHWKLSGLNELVECANSKPAPDFSQLAPLVVSCAESGDQVALDILIRAGEELAHLALLGLQQLRRLDDTSSARIAFTGSILHRISHVRNAMFGALRSADPDIEILPEAVDPVQGALWRARNSGLI